jgi:hypothetical protein
MRHATCVAVGGVKELYSCSKVGQPRSISRFCCVKISENSVTAILRLHLVSSDLWLEMRRGLAADGIK